MTFNAFEQVETLQREFAGASDRAAAVVAGAFLDEVLHQLLDDFFVARSVDAQKKLFRGNGPLSTFSAKIELAFSAGLISEKEHFDLNAIRRIRNDFAHQLGDLSFQTQSVLNRCQNIAPALALVMPNFIPLSMAGEEPPLPKIVKADGSNGRALFQESVLTLMHCLSGRVAAINSGRRTVSPKNFENAHEPAEMMLEHFKTLYEELQRLTVELRQDIRARSAHTDEAAIGDRDARDKRTTILIRAQEFFVQQIKRAHKVV
jgi:DNA-binding MltR family transcriptional regulator